MVWGLKEVYIVLVEVVSRYHDPLLAVTEGCLFDRIPQRLFQTFRRKLAVEVALETLPELDATSTYKDILTALCVELDDLSWGESQSEGQRDDPAGRCAHDQVEVVGDADVQVFFKMCQDCGGEQAPYAATVDGEYLETFLRQSCNLSLSSVSIGLSTHRSQVLTR